MEPRPTMYVLAGPNGAGKSTLYRLRLQPITSAPFINADEIRAEQAERGNHLDAYEAARQAADTRNRLLREGRSFITETVFSHESKLELIKEARSAGFRIVLYHVNVENADIAVARVRFRVSQGGHDVPEEKIRTRYERNKRFVAEAAALADLTQVYDSSKLNMPPQHILTLRNGLIEQVVDDMPAWAVELYGPGIESS